MENPLPDSSQNPPTPQRSWFGRNWKWFIPVVLSPCLICGGIVALIVSVAMGAVKSSDAYKQSLARVQSDPAVIAAIGTPIEAGFAVSGNIHVTNATGTADLAYTISGPRGDAVVYTASDKAAGQWTATMLIVQIKATGERIDLLSPSPPGNNENEPK